MPGQRQIREIRSEEDQLAFTRVYANAFPAGGRSESELLDHMAREMREDEWMTYWGAWDRDQLVGGMAILDLEVNFSGRMVPAAGIGNLCVDLAHKRRGAAGQLVKFFLDRCRDQGRHLAMLYPFRPDFYHRMGFGYGPKLHQYRFVPSSLPAGGGGEVMYLGGEDAAAIADCYHARARVQHGYCPRNSYTTGRLIERFAPRRRLVGCRQGDRLTGYLAFNFANAHDSNFLVSNLEIREWVWLDPAALATLCGFLRRQGEQVDRVIYGTHDPHFQHLLADARNGTGNLAPPISHEVNTSGVGLMYRVVSVDGFLSDTAPTRRGGGLAVNFHVSDSLRPDNARVHRLEVDGCGEAVNVHIDISDLSSLLMGSVDLAALYRLGRAGVDEHRVGVIDQALRVPRPECITAF